MIPHLTSRSLLALWYSSQGKSFSFSQKFHVISFSPQKRSVNSVRLWRYHTNRNTSASEHWNKYLLAVSFRCFHWQHQRPVYLHEQLHHTTMNWETARSRVASQGWMSTAGCGYRCCHLISSAIPAVCQCPSLKGRIGKVTDRNVRCYFLH